MPTTVSDTQDRFTELFGTKRGGGRPEDENTGYNSYTVFCRGGCGASITVPNVSGNEPASDAPGNAARASSVIPKLDKRRLAPLSNRSLLLISIH